MFEDSGDLLMDESGTAVLLSCVDRCRVEDVKTPFSWVLSEPLNEGTDNGLGDGLDGVPLKCSGVGKELPREKEGRLA